MPTSSPIRNTFNPSIQQEMNMEDERKFPVFREEVAKAIYNDRNGHNALPWHRRDNAHKKPYLSDADAALTRLRQLGTFHVDALTAIKEQEKE
jgi:hypothetical protein